MPRDDLKDLGEVLDEGNAASIVMGESRIDEEIEKAVSARQKVLQKQVDVRRIAEEGDRGGGEVVS